MQLTEFEFENNTVRSCLDENGNPWFIAKDVCIILDLDDTSKAVSRLDDDEKLTRTLFLSGQNRSVTVINESGLYSLILTSRKPEAKAFKKWVTSEVLPSIRKTGSYSTLHQPTAPTFSTPPLRPFNQRTEEAADRLIFLDIAMTAARVSDVSRLALVRKVTERVHPESLVDLPVYAVNNPDGGESSFTHGSITNMLEKLIVTDASNNQLSVQKINKQLEAHGFLRTLTYETNPKPYRSVTPKGLAYGINQVHVDYPNTTQPKCYHSRFKELMYQLGLTVRHKDKTVKVISTQKPNAKKLFKN